MNNRNLILSVGRDPACKGLIVRSPNFVLKAQLLHHIYKPAKCHFIPHTHENPQSSRLSGVTERQHLTSWRECCCLRGVRCVQMDLQTWPLMPSADTWVITRLFRGDKAFYSGFGQSTPDLNYCYLLSWRMLDRTEAAYICLRSKREQKFSNFLARAQLFSDSFFFFLFH